MLTALVLQSQLSKPPISTLSTTTFDHIHECDEFLVPGGGPSSSRNEPTNGYISMRAQSKLFMVTEFAIHA